MKGMFAIYKSIRKPAMPANRVERPKKGQGYRRRGKYGKTYGQED